MKLPDLLQVLAIIVSLFSFLISIIVLQFTKKSFKQSLNSKHYGDLDTHYIGLYKTAMDYPFVVDKCLTSNYKNSFDREKRIVYECYAEQVWIVCETMYDSFIVDGKVENKELWETWKTAIEIETNLHLLWLVDKNQVKKFKPQFINFIKAQYMENNLSVRNMEIGDIEIIDEIQRRVYSSSIAEDAKILKQKFCLSPKTCFVVIEWDKIIGYLISYPVNSRCLPLLNESYKSNGDFDTMFIHDLSIDKTHQRLGISKLLLDSLNATMVNYKYATLHLVSIQNSENFWRKNGFVEFEYKGKKRLNYGKEAKFMKKDILKRM